MNKFNIEMDSGFSTCWAIVSTGGGRLLDLEKQSHVHYSSFIHSTNAYEERREKNDIIYIYVCMYVPYRTTQCVDFQITDIN